MYRSATLLFSNANIEKLPLPLLLPVKLAKKFARLLLNLRDKSPAKFQGGLLLNIMGYQVARTLAKRAAWALRPKFPVSAEYQKYLEILNKDGIVSIPNFFSDSDFSLLEQEFKELYPHFDVHHDPKLNTISNWRKFNGTNDLRSPNIRKLFLGNKLIYELTQAVCRRPIKKGPEVAYFEMLCEEADFGKPHQFDYQDLLHYDVPYTTVKVFFYLNDVDENNGAFTYAPRSHRLSLARLKCDYRLSVDYFRKKHIRPHDQVEVPTKSELKEMEIMEKPMVAPKNTLIIANNIGFHSRQRFNNSNPRQIAYLNFRYIETLANRFSASEKREV